MIKFNQLLNNKLSFFESLTILLFSLLPISVLLGNASINFNILFIDVIFIFYCVKNKHWSWLNSQIFIHLIILYSFLIINSFYSYFFLIENELEGITRSFLFIKFILLVFAFSALIKDDKILNAIMKNWLLISMIIILDIFYEKYFGQNILGFESTDKQRIVSFFKDELVVGGYVLCFGYAAITFFLNKNLSKKSTYILLLIFLLIPITVFLTGERSNFIKSAILFLSVIFFTKEKGLFFNLKYLIIAFIILIASFVYFNDNIKDRYALFFDRILVVEKSENFYDKFKNIKYLAHFDTAFEIFKNYPISGVGNKNFRKECAKEIYLNRELQFSPFRCSTHPHQIHFEILSELGIIGYFLIMYFMIIFLIKNIQTFIKKNNFHHISNITYLALFFVPLLPGSGIFSTFNGSLFWIIFSLCNLTYEKK